MANDPRNFKPSERARRGAALARITFIGKAANVLAEAVCDSVQTGLARLWKLDDDGERIPLSSEDDERLYAPIECSSDYHFARFTGDGAAVAPLLYARAMCIAGESGNFFVSLEGLEGYLNCDRHVLGNAARLLTFSRFFRRNEGRKGKPTSYTPISHAEWTKTNGGIYCVKKQQFPWRNDSELAAFGTRLYGITNEKWFDNVLKGIINAGQGAGIDAICEAAKEFMVSDADRHTIGRSRRKRLQSYLKDRFKPHEM